MTCIHRENNEFIARIKHLIWYDYYCVSFLPSHKVQTTITTYVPDEDYLYRFIICALNSVKL